MERPKIFLRVGIRVAFAAAAWCEEGKPVVGIRTASHAFQGWLEFDREILGGDYKGHGGAEEAVAFRIPEKARDHPVLRGVEEWTGPCKMYRNPSIAADATVLLIRSGESGPEPLAWIRTYDKRKDARCFYTSMGLVEEFRTEMFRRLLVNALFWTAKRDVAARAVR